MMNRLVLRAASVLLVFVLGLNAAGCSSGAVDVGARMLSIRSSDTDLNGVIELPAEVIDNTEIVVDVMLNGTGPYRMLLDTGFAASQVSPEVARAAGIKANRYVGTIDAHGVSQREPLAVAGLVEIGGLVGRGVPMTIDALPKQIAQGSNIIGIIGYNMFTSHTLILDYPNERVFVSHDRLKSGDVGTVPMWLEDGESPYIDAAFVMPNTEIALPCKMLIDTGSGALLDLSGGFASVYGELENKMKKGASMSATGKVMPLEYARLNFDLSFNGIVAGNLMAIVNEKENLGCAIGGDFLRRFRISLDPVGKHMRFELSDGRTEVDMPVWRVHGFRIGANDDKQLYVSEVSADSQAEIGGLQVGDIMLAFDGIPITTEPLNWPLPTLDGELTERVYLIERDGEEMELVLKFQDLMPVPSMFQSMRETEEMKAEQKRADN